MEANDALNFLALRHAQLLEAVDENCPLQNVQKAEEVLLSQSHLTWVEIFNCHRMTGQRILKRRFSLT